MFWKDQLLTCATHMVHQISSVHLYVVGKVCTVWECTMCGPAADPVVGDQDIGDPPIRIRLERLGRVDVVADGDGEGDLRAAAQVRLEGARVAVRLGLQHLSGGLRGVRVRERVGETGACLRAPFPIRGAPFSPSEAVGAGVELQSASTCVVGSLKRKCL